MDFLVFKTNHGMDYAINICDVITVKHPGPITHVPGTPKGVVGMVSYQGELIAVVDTAELYYDEHRVAELMLIVSNNAEKYGILIDSISEIMRGEIPDNVRFIDPLDYKNSVLGFVKDATRIELF